MAQSHACDMLQSHSCCDKHSGQCLFPGMQHLPGLTPVMLDCEGNMDRALNWNGCANCLLNSTHTSAVPMLSGISVVVFTRERRSSGRGK